MIVLAPIINQINCQLIPSSVIQSRIQTFMTDLKRNNQIPQEQSLGSLEGCYNVFCQAPSPTLKKIQSRGWLKKQFIFFCSDCYEAYKNNNYCQYCEQIYKSTEHNEADDKEWIECELCQRWNHVDCEAIHANQAIYQEREKQYHCHQCKNVNNNSKHKKYKKETHKKTQFVSVQDTYTRTLKDDPFVYDAQFSRKVNRKPIDPLELEYVPKKSITKITVKVEPGVGPIKSALCVSKDSKQSFNIKLALSEEEIKSDLEQILEDIKNLEQEKIAKQIKMQQELTQIIKPEVMEPVKTRARDKQSQSRTDSQSHNLSPSNIETIVDLKVPNKLKKKEPLIKEQTQILSVSSRTRKSINFKK